MKASTLVACSVINLLIAGTAVGQKWVVPLDESNKKGTLELFTITSFGEPISGEPSITVARLVGGKRAAPMKGSRSMNLQYGSYIVHAQYSGAYPVEKAVTINKPFQVAFICFFTAPIETPWDGNTIRGHLSEVSLKKDCRWVRIISPFAESAFAETKASSNGEFMFESIRPGEYIGVTVGSAGTCEIFQVTITAELRQELKLSPVKTESVKHQ